jgi:hypothetical protein
MQTNRGRDARAMKDERLIYHCVIAFRPIYYYCMPSRDQKGLRVSSVEREKPKLRPMTGFALACYTVSNSMGRCCISTLLAWGKRSQYFKLNKPELGQ